LPDRLATGATGEEGGGGGGVGDGEGGGGVGVGDGGGGVGDGEGGGGVGVGDGGGGGGTGAEVFVGVNAIAIGEAVTARVAVILLVKVSMTEMEEELSLSI